MKLLIKLMLISLTIIIIITLFSCSRKELVNFADFYNISNRCSLASANYQENFVSNGNSEIKMQDISLNRFEPIYDFILALEVEDIDYSYKVQVENKTEYSFSFTLVCGNDHSVFSIEVGENYLLVTPISEDGDKIYRHNISTRKYKELIKLIVEQIDEL